MNINQLYKEVGLEILYDGIDREGRNGHTRSVFGKQIKYDMGTYGFPLLSMRKIFYKGVIGEFISFLQDAKTVKEFEANGCNYWKTWADIDGNLKLDYPPRDQLDYVVKLLRHSPESRRILIDLWNPENRGKLSLDPCHTQYQFYVRNGKLDMIWNQRSVDYAVGMPSDFVLAGCWILMLCEECGFEPGVITFNLGDTHLYHEHLDQFKAMMHRSTEALPVVGFSLMGVKDINVDSIRIRNYTPQLPIKFELKE